MIDWPKLVTALALAMRGRRHGRWKVLGETMAFAGLGMEDSTIRGWSYGRSVPNGDAAVWLVDEARERGLEIPVTSEEINDVPRGTS